MHDLVLAETCARADEVCGLRLKVPEVGFSFDSEREKVSPSIVRSAG